MYMNSYHNKIEKNQIKQNKKQKKSKQVLSQSDSDEDNMCIVID